ncbi:MAG: T9SS type A sorting domain-containing protein [Bacteroidetes bacterium]|nr:T9SS type A sorting domain-containing protein [Bacteroidota bacterium]
MKKLLFSFLATLSIFSFTNPIQAQCSLDQVGAPNYSTTCVLSDMAAAPGGTVYVASYNTTLTKFFLHSAVTTGSWTPVASLSSSLAIKPVVNVNKVNGKVYVFIRNESAGKLGEVYYLSGGSLIQLGTAVSGSNIVSDLSIAFNSLGEEYVAYTDVTAGNKSTVKKWNGSAWVAVGTGTVSAGAAYYNSLMIDNANNPVLAYQDGTSSNQTRVMKFNGSTWTSIGLLGTSTTNCKLKSANNSSNYYVGYTETTGGGVVQVYNGSTWSALGSAVTNLSSTANSFDLELDPNDNPTFTAILSTPPYPVAYKYVGVPTWSTSVSGYLTSSTCVSTNVAFDAVGSPYYFYVDQTNNNGLNVKTLTAPVSILSQPASPTVCNGFLGSINISSSGSPTRQWQVLTAGNFTNIAGEVNPSMNYTATPGFQYYRCVLNAGCKNIISNTSTVTVKTLSVSTTFTNPTCFNTGNGAISASISGGTTPYTYTWSPVGGNAATASSLYWNTYTLNASDLMGCAISTVVTLTSPPSINTSFSGNMTICSGANTSLTITASGGSPGYTYSWTPGGSLSSTTSSVVTASPGTSQTYNVTVTDAIGCTATNTVMVNVNTPPTISLSSSPSTICNGNSSTLNVTGADTYIWMPGAMTSTAPVVSPTTTTIYTVTATNTLTGCSTTNTTSIIVNPLPTVSAGPSRTLTCANTSTTLAGSTTGGVTYSWTGPGIVSGSTTLNPTINVAGTYSLTVTSAAGCTAGPSAVTVSQNTTPPSPTASSGGTITCTTSTVALTGGPASGVTYQWTGPGFSGGTTSQNAVANSAGTFTLTVTGAVNGCTNTAVTSVLQNTTTPTVSATTSTSSICAGSTTTLSATGVGVNTYNWNPGNLSGSTQILSPASTTIYTVTGTNTLTGCSAFANVTVTVNTLPTINAGPTKSITCASTFTTTSGSSVGGVSYNWTGSGIVSGYTTANCNVNAPGILSVYAISAQGCASPIATVSIVLNNTPPSVSAGNSGSITCSSPTVSLNGTPSTGVTYLWSGPGVIGSTTTQNTSANSAGTYTLKVTSTVNSCTNSAVTAVTQNTISPAVSSSVTNTLTCITNTVNAIVSTTTSPVAYTWSGAGITSGNGTATITVNSGGVKNYTVTNTNNGCSVSGSVSVIQNTVAPIANASNSTTLTCTTTTATLLGTGGGTYNWSGPGIISGFTTSSPIINLPGCYNLTVTNVINGCISTATTCISQNTVTPIVNAGGNQILTCASPTVTLIGSATPSSCTPVWTGGVISGANSFTSTTSTVGDYTLSVTNPANGCSALSIVSVLIDISIPTVTVSTNSSTLSCFNPTVSISASTTASPVSYAWTPTLGISPGTENTSNPVFTNAGSYSLTVTNTLNGCSNSDNVTILSDMTAPVISASASPSVICAGNSTTLTASGSVINNYVWTPGNLNGAQQILSPSANTSYSVVATNTINGCSTTESVSVIVNSAAPISVNGNTLICKGSTSNLTASGATSYTWNTGANTASISVTPSVTSTYTVMGDNGAGSCVASLTTVVSVISSKDISGTITSTAGATGGDVILYKYTPGLSHWDSVTTVPFTGSYLFTNIDSSQYVVRAIPTATNIQVTYGASSTSWQNATVITHGCTNNSTQNIDLIALQNIGTGPGVLTGTITEAYGYVRRMNDEFRPLVPGTPIGGIVVKGGKNPGGQMFVQTTTASDGTYTLTGLPLNTGSDSYFVFVDIPGLDTNGTYHVVITSTNTEIDHLNFNVDSMYINPLGNITAISQENSLLENKIMLFPNPARHYATIQYELIQAANVQIDLYDVIGNKVRSIVPNAYQPKDKYHHSVHLENLSSGIYFIKMKINSSESTIKLIISE